MSHKRRKTDSPIHGSIMHQHKEEPEQEKLCANKRIVNNLLKMAELRMLEELRNEPDLQVKLASMETVTRLYKLMVEDDILKLAQLRDECKESLVETMALVVLQHVPK